MRICYVSILALLVSADFPAGADKKDEVGNLGWQIKLDRKKSAAKKGNLRQFHLEYQIEFEQLTGNDTDIGGATVPGKTLQSFHQTFDVQDGDMLVYRGGPIVGNDQDAEEASLLSYRISLDTLDKDKIRLQVSTQDKRTYALKDGSTRSWNLRLQAEKTIKIGQKFKLDLIDKNMLGVKATCWGMIVEKVGR